MISPDLELKIKEDKEINYLLQSIIDINYWIENLIVLCNDEEKEEINEIKVKAIEKTLFYMTRIDESYKNWYFLKINNQDEFNSCNEQIRQNYFKILERIFNGDINIEPDVDVFLNISKLIHKSVSEKAFNGKIKFYSDEIDININKNDYLNKVNSKNEIIKMCNWYKRSELNEIIKSCILGYDLFRFKLLTEGNLKVYFIFLWSTLLKNNINCMRYVSLENEIYNNKYLIDEAYELILDDNKRNLEPSQDNYINWIAITLQCIYTGLYNLYDQIKKKIMLWSSKLPN